MHIRVFASLQHTCSFVFATRMLTKIVILTCLVAFSSQEPYVAHSLPYVANYASSYDAHVINHDVRIPVVAPVAPIVRAAPFTAAIAAAPLTSVVPQAVAGYSLGPIAASAVDSHEAAARSRSSASEEQKSAPEEPQQRNQPNAVPDAVLLASQFLARNAVNQRNAQTEQDRDAQSAEKQRNAPVLGATSNGFGFVERPVAAQQRKADFRSSRPQIDQRSGERAKLIRQNEDSESIEVNTSAVNSDSSPAYGVENSAVVKPAVLPARLAAVAPSFNILPNVYTNVITF